MALSRNQKIIIGVVGVAVLVVAVYFLTRKKPSDDELLDISDDEIDYKGTKDYCTKQRRLRAVGSTNDYGK